MAPATKKLTTADGVRVGAGDAVWLARRPLIERRIIELPGYGTLMAGGQIGDESFYSTREAALAGRIEKLKRHRAEVNAEIARLEAELATTPLTRRRL